MGKTFGSTGQGWSKLGVKDDNAGEDDQEPCSLPLEPSNPSLLLPLLPVLLVALVVPSRWKPLSANSLTPTLTLPLVSTLTPSRLPSVLLPLLLPSPLHSEKL